MRCICEALPGRAQRPAHEFHQQLQQELQRRAAEVAALSRRYSGLLRRKPAPDPLREAIVAEAHVRLRAMHQIAARYLPDDDLHQRPGGRTDSARSAERPYGHRPTR